MDNLIFMTESTKGTKDEEESSSKGQRHASVAGLSVAEALGTTDDPDIELGRVQRPVDLYKVMYGVRLYIFTETFS
jgi:G patch domain-containing protein 1